MSVRVARRHTHIEPRSIMSKQRSRVSRLSIICVTALAAASSVVVCAQENDEGNALNRYEKYLIENAKREGVTTTLSGLQYSVLTSGDGPQPGPNTPCAVHYRGTLIDGRRFGVHIPVLFRDVAYISVRVHGPESAVGLHRRHGQYHVWLSGAVRA